MGSQDARRCLVLVGLGRVRRWGVPDPRDLRGSPFESVEPAAEDLAVHAYSIASSVDVEIKQGSFFSIIAEGRSKDLDDLEKLSLL